MQTIPDLTLFHPDGSPAHLSEVIRGPTLLILLRHLA
jgi:hypothetical protein